MKGCENREIRLFYKVNWNFYYAKIGVLVVGIGYAERLLLQVGCEPSLAGR